MNRRKLRRYYFILFKILLLIAGIISILSNTWTNLILVIITFFLVYTPKIFKLKNRIEFPSKIEISILILIYLSILFENLLLINNPLILTKIIVHSIASLIIGLIGFSLIYILNREKKLIKDLDPKFIAIFAFCFSITIGSIWQIFRHIMNYFFDINIQNYYASDALGFLTIHTAEAIIISIFGYLFLISEDKYYIKKILRKSLGIDKNTSLNELRKLIKKGESESLEFKETLRYNLHTKQYDKKIELSSLKTLVGFLNSKGGILLIGVSDNNSIKGLDIDNFKNEDKCLLHLTNLIKKYIGTEYSPYIKYNTIKIKNSFIIKIKCKKSDREVFLKEDNTEKFYIRSGPSSQELEGSKLIKYIKKRFK